MKSVSPGVMNGGPKTISVPKESKSGFHPFAFKGVIQPVECLATFIAAGLAILLLLLPAQAASWQPETPDRVATVTRTPGLVAFWDFVKREPAGERRFTAHLPPGATNDFALAAGNYVRDYWGEGRAATYADFPLLGRGPFGNAIRIRPEADPNFRPLLHVPRTRLHDSPLDLKGAGRSVSIVGWAIRESGNHALAGIWHEGTTKVRLTLRQTATGTFTEASRDLVALRLNPWWYPHAISAPPDDGSGGPFTIGRVIHSSRGVGFTGWIGGVAVFNRALRAEELDKLTRLASPAKGGPSGASLEEVDAARGALALYRAELDKFRKEFAVSDRVPDVPFFLFGMGARAKHWYQAGQLREAPSGRVARQWAVREAILVPPEYRVVLALEDGGAVELREDEEGVWLTENGRRARLAGSEARVNLPDFAGHRYPRVLRVLHQELLVNVIHGQPVPNLFVYPRAWLRDAAMMGMAFEATGNLPVIRDWILGLREVYDRNNAGEEEADNLGQALYLISLVSDASHPLVEQVLAELPRWEVIEEGRTFIRGRSDFATHPVYQTKWLKFGLGALGLPDPYTVPPVKDSYSALFWWDYRDAHLPGSDARDRGNYPYLGWAVDHFNGEKGSPISNRDYPLTWEQRASQADFSKLNVLDSVFARERIAAPHTWHAAEVFLCLLKERPAP